MAERYQLKVAEGQVPSAFLRSYNNGSAGQVGAAWGQVGGELGKWGAWLKERQDKWDAATVMNAQTEFARRMSERLDHPETGWTVTRKGSASLHMTEDTDAYADKVAQEISEMLENDQQRAVFNSGIAKAKLPYMRQASTHEARELEVHHKQAFEANIAAANDCYLRGADSPELRQQAVDMAANAIRSRYFGAPTEYIDRAIAETKSGMASQWVAKVAQDDPRAAMKMLEDESLGLLPEAANKLRAAIKPKAEIYEIQAIADELIQDYPQGTEQELYRVIRRDYGGEKEERIITAVKARVNERHIKEDNEERALKKQQGEYFDTLLAGMLRGEYPTHEQIEQDVDSGKLDPSHGWRLDGMIQTQATAAGTRKRLERTMPGWSGMSTEQQDEAVMLAMPDGPTRGEHEAEAARLLKMVFDGNVTNREFETEVKATLGNMRITRREAAELLGIRGKLKEEQKAFLGGVQKDLNSNLNQLFSTSKGQKASRDAAEAYFREAVSRLDPNSTTYRKDVLNAMKDAMVRGIEASGEKLMNSHWFWEDTPTKFGERYDALMGALDKRIKGMKEYDPRFTMDSVNLPETREAPRRAANVVGKTSYDELRTVVDNSAKTHGVEPALVRAIIQQESGWKTDAVSSKGAQGLMQLMPKTASGLGVTDAFDAEQNINGGTKYIADMLKRYGGDVEKALAAYNAGPARVPVEGELDFNKFPKKVREQTEPYVKNVMALYRKYQGEARQAQEREQAKRKPTVQEALFGPLPGDFGEGMF